MSVAEGPKIEPKGSANCENGCKLTKTSQIRLKLTIEFISDSFRAISALFST